ncbi:Outer membrane efflux protein [uncultured Paludibacter sp.]|uniref:Outer membrane efflux protein n=1 Tax=uncultured Paludibacter sp. TaxID=497635 RepID=A0A653AKI1_9BACT|nr:Outer membrane efflux protein [uncultured Paludibacter sp.]
MKRKVLIYLLVSSSVCGWAQNTLSLDSCRKMALEHNKNLQISQENLNAARELKKSAFTQLLPNFSANAAYTWNQKNISLLSEDALLPVGVKNADGSFGTGITSTSVPTPNADGTLTFKDAAISNKFTVVNGTPVPLDANGQPFNPTKNPEKLLWKNYAILPKEAMEFDIQNLFVGTITMFQPIFTGGKLLELNKLAKYNENLAVAQQKGKAIDILVEVDEAYWRVVSLENKLKLAQEYRNMLAKMNANVTDMVEEGVATKSDELKVKVKLNEAEVSVTRAENGLNLSKMALNQLCGLPLEQDVKLQDENLNEVIEDATLISTEKALDQRPEIMMLTQLQNIAKSNEKMMFSRFLPNIGLTANYLISNPNSFNGYEKKFGGMFNVGVAASIPLFHFGDKIHTLNASKAQSRIAELQLEEAKEKMTLQINQSTYKVLESIKKEQATSKNIEQAEENLRLASEGFNEGVITSTDFLGAQTAWLSTKSDDIDAKIDVMLNQLYLKRASGEIEVPIVNNNLKKK